MRIAIGTLIALSVLLVLIVGPIYLAVTQEARPPSSVDLCEDGDLACEANVRRPDHD